MSGFEKELDDVINGVSDQDFTYKGEQEFEPKPKVKSEEDETTNPNPGKRGKPKKKKSRVGGPGKKKPKPKVSGKTADKKYRVGVVIISVVLACGLLAHKFGLFGSSEAPEEIEPPTQANQDLPDIDDGMSEPEKQEKGESSVVLEDTINPGIPDMNNGDNNKMSKSTTDAEEFTKDINGHEIPKRYEVDKIYHTVDFVNYTKKRGVTSNGVELLWLDAEYKGNPYTIQVPFQIWKELDTSGITVVNMEVLVVDKDKEIISYMEVKNNFKEVMAEGEKGLKDRK